ncbi:MAG: DoxX-like family protein [Gemmatimonadaceae bacterium]|jgi:uncharacterized membrane protein YphA (DoxX/SURF4 family)|nr:DoxX-like family protein [Gemmatimonadaceae bacterium]
MSLIEGPVMLFAAQLLIGAVWIFHGLYSKLLRGIPRHRAIVARVLGERHADVATTVIGVGEIALGAWVLSGWQPVACAVVQTTALVAMNALEIALAADLLLSAAGMVALNAGFLAIIWSWALRSHG